MNQYLSCDFLGGPKHLKLAWVVNFQKGMTFFWVLGLIYYFNNQSTQALVYLALHGCYGFCWLLKDVIFPDPNWQKRVTYGGAFMAVAMVLGPYWLFSYLLISPILGDEHVGASPFWLTAAIMIHTLGIAIMLIADAQKYFTLKFTKGLITSGVFKYIRHPNYLGEIMIYGSYAIVVWHWIPWLILGVIWIQLFLVNMFTKEASMSRYPEWCDYFNSTGMLLPKIFKRNR
ncbi:MAG: DUF1295 domain-containing protein [Kangiellaceae bacterium]|nr:DUF1295 domain-containing protein [Kangiellaceae bacterium]